MKKKRFLICSACAGHIASGTYEEEMDYEAAQDLWAFLEQNGPLVAVFPQKPAKEGPCAVCENHEPRIAFESSKGGAR